MANFKVAGVILEEFSWQQKKKILRDATFFVWDKPRVFKILGDGLLRRCVNDKEARDILWHCINSPYGGHFNGERTTDKILQVGFYWPTFFKCSHTFVKQCD
jgi:hypothetical protein